MDGALRKEASTWDALGRVDPLGAIAALPEKKGNRWSLDEFFKVGATRVRAVADHLGELRVHLGSIYALDFGCGVGRHTQALAELFDHVVGVDVAPSMLELARQLNSHG